MNTKFLVGVLLLSLAASAQASCYVCSHRNPEVRREFMRTHPCPSTGKTYGRCPGYVVDHIQALKHGGADATYNLQWQTTQDAKAKDKRE